MVVLAYNIDTRIQAHKNHIHAINPNKYIHINLKEMFIFPDFVQGSDLT